MKILIALFPIILFAAVNGNSEEKGKIVPSNEKMQKIDGNPAKLSNKNEKKKPTNYVKNGLKAGTMLLLAAGGKNGGVYALNNWNGQLNENVGNEHENGGNAGNHIQQMTSGNVGQIGESIKLLGGMNSLADKNPNILPSMSPLDVANLAENGLSAKNHLENIWHLKAIENREFTHFDGILANLNGQNGGNEAKINVVMKELNEGLTKEGMAKLMGNGRDGVTKITLELPPQISHKFEQKIEKITGLLKKVLEISVEVTKNEMAASDDKNYQKKAENPLNLVNYEGKDELELGRELIRNICEGNGCDPDLEQPEFGATSCSIKQKPEADELDRSLRPMLLKLGAKLEKGRLWVDNPIANSRNGFKVGWTFYTAGIPFDPLSDRYYKLRQVLSNFEENTPIRFEPYSKEFKNELRIIVHRGKSSAPNGLQRDGAKNDIFINERELDDANAVHKLILKAMGVEMGEELRIKFDRRDEYMPPMRTMFAKLNAAYGAENYEMHGDPTPRLQHPFGSPKELQFWTDYPNYKTGKYEIPVVFDSSFVKLGRKHADLINEVFDGFVKNSAIQFVLHKNAPMNKHYVRVYKAEINKAYAHIGHYVNRNFLYRGMTIAFGADMMRKCNLYHEFMHTAEMHHEHQRADADEYVKARPYYDEKFWKVNLEPHSLYLPVHEYNVKSIMHYPKFFFENSFGNVLSKRQENVFGHVDEPDQKDWENLNHFYGIGKGRTQFKVENGKIVEDLDGLRRFR